MERRALSSKGPTTASRRRINGRACASCHERKTRCDLGATGPPCSNCASQGRQDCRLYQRKGKGRNRALVSSLRSHVPIQPRHSQPSTASGSPPASTQPKPGLPRQNQSLTASTESEASASQAGDAAEEHGSRNLAEFIGREELRVAEINSQSRMCFIGTELSNINYLVRQHSRVPGDEGRVHLGSRPMDLKCTSHGLKQVPPDALELPEKALADELVQTFFVHVNRGWPLIEEGEFMAQYNQNPRVHTQLPLLNAMFLLGAHILAPKRPEMAELKPRFFRRIKTLIDCRFEQDRVMYVLVALLMTWHSDGLEDIVANSWYWVGIATRAAQGLGMHRDTSKSSLTPMHKRIWTRIWWVLFQFDVMVSLAYGRPQALHLDDSDVPEPRQSDFEGIPHAKVDFCIHHARLCIIISKTMRKRTALRSTEASRLQATKDGDQALADFLVELPEQLRQPLPQADIWQATLNLTYNNFLILLHRPPPMSEAQPHRVEAASDSAICGDATAVVTSTLETLRARGELSKLWWCGNHALFTAIVHISAELESPNPLVVATSSRMFDSLLLSLRDLSRQWLYAQTLLRLFEERASRAYQQRRSMTSTADAHRSSRPTEEPHTGTPEFSLRPNPLGDSAPYLAYSTGDPTAMPMQPTSASRVLGHSSHIGGSMGIQHGHGAHPGDQGVNVEAGDAVREQVYHGGLFGGDLGMLTNGGDLLLNDLPFPEASALEELLAGMTGNEYEYGYAG